MRKLLFIAVAAAGVLPAAVDWPVATPRSQGFDPARLQAFQTDAAAHHTRALFVARNGKIVLEWYEAAAGPDTKQGTASLAKALVGGMSLLVALNDGRIRPDDLAAQFIPRWKSDPRKSRITIRQLATHTSGIADAEQDDLPHDQLPGWKGAFWKRRPDPISIALDQAPVLFEPGKGNEYSNPGMAALAYAVTASLRGAPQSDIRTLLEKRIFEPTRIPQSDWRISYDESYDLDGLRVYANWGGAAFTPRATARIGQLMLQKGVWEGRQLLRRETVEEVTSYAGMPKPAGAHDPGPASGLCWYTNYDGAWSGVPRDAFAGAGANQQTLLVVPSLNLVVVRNGAYLGPEGDKRFWGDLVTHIFQPVVAAIVPEAAPPYPPSPVIRKIVFDPLDTIQRKAPDSDNWPITWADDGDLYMAYGDGHGFEPLIQPKLSLGLAKVSGMPPAFTAENIRSETAERTGGGAKGLKASGMLMVDGVLYMWVRNAGNSQLAWSADHGRTWQWGFKLTEGFGAPAFLNFGKNYTGARDSYVYTYSQDGPSAYESYDGVALARVPRSRIRDREAYEFFLRLDQHGRPVWTRDIAQRGPVFSYPGHCQRVDAIYHPVLKRYLLAMGYNQESGWGIYDAPEPWGPWTLAFHTLSWDVPGSHGYRLPSKWIAADGRSMYLVFSGVKENDAFCVRRMTVESARH
jgi:CubicO group peptidase (beta-lactamase class C family)